MVTESSLNYSHESGAELLEKAILDAARQAGLKPSAIPDLLARAQQVWQIVDGNLRAIGPDGSEIYGPTADPLTPEEWLATLTKDAPHHWVVWR